MTLRLRTYGIATAYATVGVGDVGPEIKVSRAAANGYDERLASCQAEGKRPVNRELWPPELLFLLGQADVATIYKTTNFKRIFELRYPRAGSKAGVVNWVFSVPFDSSGPDDASGPAALRFMIHLRLRRAVYAYPGIAEQIVKKLTTLLGPNAAGARVHAGLGWNDLMVEGYFDDTTFTALIDFILAVHSLKIVSGPEHARRSLPVLQRILTVFGYRETDPPDPPEFNSDRHLTFLRGAPGGYDDVLDLFSNADIIDILDGKADFMVSSGPAQRNWLREQRKLGEKANRPVVRKVETHLMFVNGRDFAERQKRLDRVIEAGPIVLHEDDCGCDTAAESLIRDIDATMDALARGRKLPIEQRYAIDNALFLLTGTLRDSSICCDVRDAVMACFHGLLHILRLLSAECDRPDLQYRQVWARLNDWHQFSELLLRQRTVGSYDEILGQSDRSIAYSGGVQKFLYLADQLMKDFARRIEPVDPPSFATIYDSVKTIFSFVRTAPIVRMPTSQIFGFPLIVPDLWHEVAGRLFFLRTTEPLVKTLKALGYDGELLEDYVANLADHYADIIVYLFGFNGDFHKFLVSLVHGWKVAYRGAPEQVVRRSDAHFLLRAYLVYELDRVRTVRADARKTRDFARLKEFADPTIADVLVADLQAQLVALKQNVADAAWELLKGNVRRADFSHIHRQLYQQYVDTQVQARSVDLAPFDAGNIVDLQNVDINELFGELAHRMAKNYPEATDFVTTAALGESAALEYHRRQMTSRRLSGDRDAAI
ncbi:MAG TPA: hypothetical protein VF618_18960 [Thermoanaerobaculia bacterium]